MPYGPVKAKPMSHRKSAKLRPAIWENPGQHPDQSPGEP